MNHTPVILVDQGLQGLRPTSPAGWAGPVFGSPSSARSRRLSPMSPGRGGLGSEALTLPADISGREACDGRSKRPWAGSGGWTAWSTTRRPPAGHVHRTVDPEGVGPNITVNLLGPYS